MRHSYSGPEDSPLTPKILWRFKEGKANRRRTPIHNDLLKISFLEYVEKMRQRGAALFPDLRPDSRGHLTGLWSKWWGRYLHGPCGIGERGKDLYSFRHTFKYAARQCGIPEDAHNAMTGHKNDSLGLPTVAQSGTHWSHLRKP